MRTVWKFTLQPNTVLAMPVGSEVLHVGVQEDKICLWVLVDPTEVTEPRRFKTFGTGHPICDQNIKFVGTTFFHGGSLVFHTFEVIQ